MGRSRGKGKNGEKDEGETANRKKKACWGERVESGVGSCGDETGSGKEQEKGWGGKEWCGCGMDWGSVN